MSVPAGFVVTGPAPVHTDKVDKTCTDCGQPYSTHTGRRCACCGDPVEHHVTGNLDFAACLAGRQRMAAARRDVGQPLDHHDQLALNQPGAP